MFIMCQNCHRIYDVPTRLLGENRQTFRCQACGFVWTGETQSEQACDDEFVEQTNGLDVLPEPADPILDDVLDENVRKELHADDVQESDFISDEPEDRPRFFVQADDEPDNVLETPLPDDDVFTAVEVEKTTDSVGRWVAVGVISALLMTVLATFWMGRFYLSRQFSAMNRVYQMLKIDAHVTGEGLDFKDSVFDVIFEQNVPVMLIRGNVINTASDTKDVPFIRFVLFDAADKQVQEQTIVPIKEKIEPGEELPFETKIKPVRSTVRRVDITFKKGLEK